MVSVRKGVRAVKTTTLIAVAVVFALSGAVTVSTAAAGQSAALVDIELKDVPVKEAIARLFEGTGLSYYAVGGISGRIVELRIKGITFDQALGALTDAADLTYVIDEGTYIIGPADRIARAKPAPMPRVRNAPPRAVRPPPGPAYIQGPPVGAVPPPETQVVVNQQASPVYYAQGGGSGYPYGGYGGGYGGGWGSGYRIGNVGVVGGGWGNPVVFAGAGPTMLARRYPPPPPPGWVSPDMLRFLRFRYVVPSRPYIGYPVSYGW